MKQLLLFISTFFTTALFSQSVIVLPQDGSYSSAAAPQGAYRYERRFYLINTSEMQSAGFTSGMVINSIGFTTAVAQNDSTKGKFKVYLQNTTNNVSRTDTGWTTVSVTGNTYHLNGLRRGSYDWQVKSICTGTTIDSTASTFTNSNLTGCNQPTGLSTSSITSTSAALNWIAPANAGVTGYVVQYSRLDSVNWISDTVTTTTKSLTGLLASKNYQWRVKTVCPSGYSDFSNVIFLTEPVTAGCNIPSGLTSSAVTNTSATVSWSAATGANYYGVQYRRAGTASWTNTIAIQTSFSITGLNAGTTYEYKVRTVCAAGNGAFSSSSTFTTTGTTACYAPVTLAADSLTDSSAVLRWNNTGATSYTLRYRAKDVISWTNAITPMTLVHNDSILLTEAAGSYDVPFTNGSAFTYNGGGVYVAFEYADSADSVSSKPSIALCTTRNTVLKGVSGQDSVKLIMCHGANQQDTLPSVLDATSIRPETRFGSPSMKDSVEVSAVYALGNNAIAYGSPSPVSALIRNKSNTNRTYTVSLVIKDQATNAVRYNPSSQTITVNAHAANTVSFTGWNPTLIEKDSIIISVPADSGENYTANNKAYYIQNNNNYIHGYDDGSSPVTSAGFDTSGGLLLTKYTMNGCGRVNGASVYLTPSAKNHSLRAVVLNNSGSIVDSSAYFTPDSSATGKYHSFYFLHTPLFSGADYYVGLAQTKDAVNGYNPVGAEWEGTDIRTGAYYRAGLTGGTVTDNPSPGRLMIKAEIIPAVPSVTITGQTSLCPSGTNVLTATTTSQRFADRVIAVSSQVSSSDFSGAQALGAPDIYPSYNFNTNNWASSNPDNNREYIELGFPGASKINYVDIYETYNPGAVDSVYVLNPNTNAYVLVYSDSASPAPAAARIKRVTFPATSYNVSAIRIGMNSSRVSGYNAIDAVAIGAINDSAYVANATYLWSTAAATQTVSASTAGTYSVTVTDANSCSQRASVTLTNHAMTTPVITANRATTFCTGDTAVILTSSTLTGNLWSTGATTRSITVSTSGNYTVSYNDNSGCGSAVSAVKTVTVNPLPVVSITGSLQYCQGSSTSLNAGSGYTAYQWSNGALTQSITAATPGSYTATVTNSNGCKGRQTVNVTVAALPSPSITGNLNFCPGSSTTLDAGAGFNSYNWSTGASTRTINANTASTYTVTVSNSNGCTKSTSVTIQALSSPAPFVIGNQSFCPGGSTTLTANFGYSSYLWSNSTASRSVNINSGGTYTVTVTDGNGCTGSISAIVQQFPTPTPVITGTTSICPSSSSVIDAGTGWQSYNWSTGASTHAISVNTAGTFTVTVTDSNNCAGSTSIATTLNNNAITAVGTISGQTSGLCNTTNKTFSVAPVPNATFYQWTIPAVDSIISGQGTPTINVYFRSFTVGSIAVVALNSCGQSPVRTLEVLGAPATPASISGPTVVCRTNGNVYTITPVSGASGYTWTVPPGMTIVSGQGTSSITVNGGTGFTSSGDICVTATSSCGVSGTRCLNVTAKPPMPLSVTGPVVACKKQANVLYATSAVSGATTYNWTAPSGAKITSGAGTNSIRVSFGTNAGNITVNAANACGSSTVKSLAVTFNCREDEITAEEYSIYPNPSDGITVLTFNTATSSKYTVDIYDMTGKLVLTEMISAQQGLNQYPINLSGKSQGIYMIRFGEYNGPKTSQRIVVE